MASLTPVANLPLLHGGDASPSGPLWTDWHVAPTVVLGVVAIAAAYLVATGPLNRRRPRVEARPVRRRQRVTFLLGCVVLLVALGPPLDDWSDRLLLSAHMVQHLLLILVVAPLWLLGTPAWLLRPLLRRPAIARIGWTLTRPVAAFVLPNAVFTLWHLPALYDAALRAEPVHIVEHLLFLGTALLAWWPVLGPLSEWPRLSLPLQCLYLFLQTLPGAFIGSFITFARPGVYTPYVDAPRMWGISLATDQQIAGLLMWIFTATVYLLLLSIIFFRWAAEDAAADAPGPVRPRHVAAGR